MNRDGINQNDDNYDNRIGVDLYTRHELPYGFLI